MTANDKASVLVLSFTDPKRDPRVSRQIIALQDDYDLTTPGEGPSGTAGSRHVELVRRRPTLVTNVEKAVWLKTRQYMEEYPHGAMVRDAWSKLRGAKSDMVVANDLETLPLAVKSQVNAARFTWTPMSMSRFIYMVLVSLMVRSLAS